MPDWKYQAQEKTEDGLVQYNEEVNKLGDDLKELYGNVGEILGRIRDGTLEVDIYGAESIKAEAVTEKWSDLVHIPVTWNGIYNLGW